MTKKPSKKIILIIVAIVVVVIAAIVGISLVGGKGGADTSLYIKIINGDAAKATDMKTFLDDSFKKSLAKDDSYVIETSYTKMSDKDQTEAGKNMEDVLIEVVASKIDIFVTDKTTMDKLNSSGYIVSLDSIIGDDTVSGIKDKVTYANDVEGMVVPMSINITDTEFAKTTGIVGDVYLSVVENMPHEKNASEFIKAILDI